MRTFFGLELAANTAVQLADWRDRQLLSCGRPVPPANFHITLAFIGELSPGAQERLCLALDDWLAGADVRGGALQLDCVGYWPRPGIYWLGPTSWPESLSQLASKLRSLATAAVARRDRNPFQPHVTLFRNCTVAPAAPVTTPDIAMSYRHLTLFESRLGRAGVSYHPLQEWDLPPAATR